MTSDNERLLAAMDDLMLTMETVGAANDANEPHACLVIDPTIDGPPHMVVGPFPTAADALVYAEKMAAVLNKVLDPTETPFQVVPVLFRPPEEV